MFGPVELFSRVADRLTVTSLGPAAGPVASSQGAAVVADAAWADAGRPDIVLVPGGMGTRGLVSDDAFLAWLRDWAAGAALVTSVCTGSGVLSAAGLLDGYRATSNKRAFAWASGQGTGVEWVAEARWVHDRDRWTSSGVAAGTDMAFALLADLFGEAVAQEAADGIELEVQRDPAHDRFAALNGLV